VTPRPCSQETPTIDPRFGRARTLRPNHVNLPVYRVRRCGRRGGGPGVPAASTTASPDRSPTHRPTSATDPAPWLGPRRYRRASRQWRCGGGALIHLTGKPKTGRRLAVIGTSSAPLERRRVLVEAGCAEQDAAAVGTDLRVWVAGTQFFRTRSANFSAPAIACCCCVWLKLPAGDKDLQSVEAVWHAGEVGLIPLFGVIKVWPLLLGSG